MSAIDAIFATLFANLLLAIAAWFWIGVIQEIF
jgi:hypothetical protein